MFKANRLSIIILCLVVILSVVGCSSADQKTADSSLQSSETPANSENGSGEININDIKADLRMTTASMTSNGQVLGSGICSIVSKHLPNIRASAITTQGSTENVRLMESKECELSIINADAAYAAANGLEPYDNTVELYSLFKISVNQCVFVTMKNSGITSMEQLEGKRVSVGPPGSGGLALATSVLKGYDLWDKVDKVYLAYADQAEALKDGTIDAMMAHLSTNSPAAYFSELDATSDDIYILGQSEEFMTNIQKTEPFQVATILKPGENLRECK